MISITIIGSGNVAHHLINVFLDLTENQANQVVLEQVWARNSSYFSNPKIPFVAEIQHLKPTDLTIIAVSDHAITNVSEQLPFKNQLVVHTSGSTPLLALSTQNRRGVFYPLQTFSKLKAIDFSSVPIILESEQQQDFDLLQKIAELLSKKVVIMNSVQRKALHVAAVFACNFTNHLYAIAEHICQTHEVDFQLLAPLIEETTQKIKSVSPLLAQTGPAKRNDVETINQHLSLITEDFQKEIYQLLTQSIQEYDKKL
uniref:Rossmann-like and DUF2520 domain-containing protein n=1 Tax=Flavobacterium sp. TaxID=239 RepID=UPI00404B12C2